MGRNRVFAVLVVSSVACGGQVLEPVESWGDGGSGGATGGEGGVSQTGGTGGWGASGGTGGSGATGGTQTGGTAGTGGTGGTTGGAGGTEAGGSFSGFGVWCETEPPPGSPPATVSPECEGTEPAQMVTLPNGFAIDATEVTRCQYEVWLASGPFVHDPPAMCEANCGFTPQVDWPPNGKGDYPVVGVDWCDAYAYCAGVGKRLCGALDGGPTEYNLVDDPAASQWMNACTSGGKYETVTGEQTPQKCNWGGVGSCPLPACRNASLPSRLTRVCTI